MIFYERFDPFFLFKGDVYKKGNDDFSHVLTSEMFAELSGNCFFPNYIWRGMTQTMDDPGHSGGFDYSHESGFYAEHGDPTLLLVVLD